MNLGSLQPDRVEEVLLRHGAEAITLSDARDEPVLEPGPGEVRLWPNTEITALFSAHADFDGLNNDLQNSLQLARMPEHRIEILEDRAWERTWLEDFRPMLFGNRLWVCPGEFVVAESDAVVVRLDPGLAFGTGTHETTALCLEWLDGTCLAGKRVLDFGCGSGILAVAALRLGARSAVGVDIDPQAKTATRANARNNGVEAKLSVFLDAAELNGKFDVVLANILAGPLVDNVALICGLLRPGGALALSGILVHQADEVLEAYRGRIEFAETETRGDWVCLSGVRTGDS